MIDIDEITYPYDFVAENGVESICDLTLWNNAYRAVVIFTERKDNTGNSVTNACEVLATRVKNEFLWDYPIDSIRFFEHYDADDVLPDRYSEISFGAFWRNRYLNPAWRHCERAFVMGLMQDAQS